MLELIQIVLPDFARRPQPFYRSMLRVAVKNADPMRPARSFGNKDEWRVALKALQEAEVLTYSEEDDDVCFF